MHAPRRSPRVISLLSIAALLAVVCSVSAASAANHPTRTLNLGGKWSGTYSGAVSGSFTLQWTQSNSRLTGTITLSRPHGTYRIGGLVRGDAISFGAVT